MKNKTLKEEIIKSKLSKIVDTLEVIEEHLPNNFDDFRKSRLIRDAVYKETEFSIEIILDICSILNKSFSLGMPETEESILNNLERKKIFSKKTIEILKEMKKLRNILVHRYGEIDDERAFETIKNGLNDFELFVAETEKILKQSS